MIFLEGGKGNNSAAVVGKGRETMTRLNKLSTGHGPLVSQLLCVHKLTFELMKSCVSVSVSHIKGGKRTRHHRDLAAWTPMERWRSQFENENQTQPS